MADVTRPATAPRVDELLVCCIAAACGCGKGSRLRRSDLHRRGLV